MKIYTIQDGNVSIGAKVETLELKKADVKIPVIKIGEEGRGRETGIVAVHLSKNNHERFQNGEEIKILNAYVGKTRTGLPKLYECGEQEIEEDPAHAFCFIVVFRTPFGFRGSNSHTGDRDYKNSEEEKTAFLAFPEYQNLATGIVADGAAGGMASGQQLISIMPMHTVFRTGYTGRRYGNPHAHYYFHDGSKLIAATWEERQLAELF